MPRINQLVLSGLALVAGIACGQGTGERCEIQSDCKSGLICDLGVATPEGAYNGICKAPVVMVPIDVDVGVAAPAADAGGEIGASPDAPHDGFSPDGTVVGSPDVASAADGLMSVDGAGPDVASVSDAANTD